MRIVVWIFLLSTLLTGCGSSSNTIDLDPSVATDLPTVLHRVDPATAHAGDTITLFGFGFSVAAAENLLVVGDTSAAANTYSLLATPATDELESLTVTLPTSLTPGDYALTLFVHETQSNDTVTLTITP